MMEKRPTNLIRATVSYQVNVGTIVQRYASLISDCVRESSGEQKGGHRAEGEDKVGSPGGRRVDWWNNGEDSDEGKRVGGGRVERVLSFVMNDVFRVL
jgi:hypothetical protein